MKGNSLLSVLFMISFFSTAVFGQIATGSIYGKIVDDKGAPLPGVSITLKSNVMPPETAMSGPPGGFRFANLPPSTYSMNFVLDGYMELRQENVQVSTGQQVQLEITMNPSVSEKLTVVGETPVVDTRQTGAQQNFKQAYLKQVPTARHPWVILDQTPGVDTSMFDVGGSESAQVFVNFFGRGDEDHSIWNYDGMPTASYNYSFNAFEEVNIVTGGNDVSAGSSGMVVNIVTKRGGNKWSGNVFFNFSNQGLQWDNTPAELAHAGAMSNRIDDMMDYGFDFGGPILKDRLYVWGAVSKNDLARITVDGSTEQTNVTSYNAKVNLDWNPSNESQLSFFMPVRRMDEYALYGPTLQAPETLDDERSPWKTGLSGIWNVQHTWIPSDHTMVTGRYGYLAESRSWFPNGGIDKPMVLLSSIPRYEDTFLRVGMAWSTHTIKADIDHYEERMLGGDHEFRFGLEYGTREDRYLSMNGNGVSITDYDQAVPGGPLKSGEVQAEHYSDSNTKADHISFYIADTYRKDHLTLNLGVRFDSTAARNLPSSIPAVPGYEQYVGAFHFAGNDPGVRFNNWSPRIGATYDVTGSGKMVIRGNFARYYDPSPPDVTFINPASVPNGVTFFYTNRNGDRTITPDELTSVQDYYGGLAPGGFNLENFLTKNQIDPHLSSSYNNEYIIGMERQFGKDSSVAIQYMHRDYYNYSAVVPAGITSADYQPAGHLTWDTILGNFDVPIYMLPEHLQDGTQILRNIDGYVRSYDGLDIMVRKRMSRNFMINAGLVLQRQKAHYKSPDAAAMGILIDYNGTFFPFDPGQVSFLNNQTYANWGRSEIFPFSEWNLTVSGVYQFPRDFTFGAYMRYKQGYPYVLFGSFPDCTLSEAIGCTQHQILVEPFSSRRYGNIFLLDLQLEKGFDIGRYGRLSLNATVFNVTNTNTVLRRVGGLTATDKDGVLIAQQPDSFNAIEEIISPRVLRFGIRYNF